MNLYLLERAVEDYNDYDIYTSFVVAAETEEEARHISPCDFYKWSHENESWMFEYSYKEPAAEEHKSWTHPKNVIITNIGKAKSGTKQNSIIITSFNAG